MKLPTIAPLTRLEAKAARVALPHMIEGLRMLTDDAEHRPFAQASVDELQAALAEYEARGRVLRLVPQPAGHKTRLWQWFHEVAGYTEARLAEMRGGDTTP